MNKHRSLAEALTTDPKKLEFIQGGSRRPELPRPNERQRTPVVATQTNTETGAEPSPTKSAPEIEGKAASDGLHGDDRSHATAGEDERRAPSRRSREKGRGAAPEPRAAKPSLTQPVVPFTTRFRQSTAEALRRASLERKLAGEALSSQQEIVEHCLSNWLKANGYLDSRD